MVFGPSRNRARAKMVTTCFCASSRTSWTTASSTGSNCSTTARYCTPPKRPTGPRSQPCGQRCWPTRMRSGSGGVDTDAVLIDMES
ncbi:hypothetical protein PR202_gb13243 [Eleusine coracana subsp. coracana]|uniref:Uncharacterized protein n=1 Tax=Eleusine coracana subsp. coracana TaxID=191504 RepID=A0AAV5EQ24_ELECO|nr:hypothetical protein PR202_gb13243 [Eleusine coracana subsp. coracana]